jgi:hypothetical protein
MNVKIMYVGSGTRPAFLDRLAKASGGVATTDDLKEQKQLTDKITLLLTPAVDDSPRKGGSIQL